MARLWYWNWCIGSKKDLFPSKKKNGMGFQHSQYLCGSFGGYHPPWSNAVFEDHLLFILWGEPFSNRPILSQSCCIYWKLSRWITSTLIMMGNVWCSKEVIIHGLEGTINWPGSCTDSAATQSDTHYHYSLFLWEEGVRQDLWIFSTPQNHLCLFCTWAVTFMCSVIPHIFQ